MLQTVALNKVRPNKAALRGVKRESEDYLGIVASMREHGFVGSIIGSEKIDPDTSEMYYEIVDGLQRFSAATDLGLDTINIDVLELEGGEAEILELQICGNIHKVETRPAEYSRQLERLLTIHPTRTRSDLATKLGKSIQWVDLRLSLNKIVNPKIQELINDEVICISNASALARLPEKEQVEWSDRAQTDTPDVFLPAIAARVKELKEAKSKGKTAGPIEFAPVAHVRNMKDMRSENEKPSAGPILCKAQNLSTAAEGFDAGVKWAIHLDPDSIKTQSIKFDDRKIAKIKAAAERKEKKAKEASDKAAKSAVEAQEANTALTS